MGVKDGKYFPGGLTVSVAIVRFNIFVGKSSLYVFLEASEALDTVATSARLSVTGDEVGLFDLLVDFVPLGAGLSLCVLWTSSAGCALSWLSMVYAVLYKIIIKTVKIIKVEIRS